MAHCEVEMPPALRLCVDSANIMDVIVDFFPVESREVRNPADLAGMPCMHAHPGFRRAHTRRPGYLVLPRWCCGDASSQQKEGWSCFYLGEATLCRVSDSRLQGPPRAGSDVAGGTILRAWFLPHQCGVNDSNKQGESMAVNGAASPVHVIHFRATHDGR